MLWNIPINDERIEKMSESYKTLFILAYNRDQDRKLAEAGKTIKTRIHGEVVDVEETAGVTVTRREDGTSVTEAKTNVDVFDFISKAIQDEEELDVDALFSSFLLPGNVDDDSEMGQADEEVTLEGVSPEMVELYKSFLTEGA